MSFSFGSNEVFVQPSFSHRFCKRVSLFELNSCCSRKLNRLQKWSPSFPCRLGQTNFSFRLRSAFVSSNEFRCSSLTACVSKVKFLKKPRCFYCKFCRLGLSLMLDAIQGGALQTQKCWAFSSPNLKT